MEVDDEKIFEFCVAEVLLLFSDLAIIFFNYKITVLYFVYRAGQNQMHFMFASHHTSWLFKIIRLLEERSGNTLFSMR